MARARLAGWIQGLMLLVLCACGQQPAAQNQALSPAVDTAQAFGIAGIPFLSAKHLALPYTIRGVNYYPQQSPWNRFWSDTAPATLSADFARIQGLGFNTVRIFVDYAAFGGAQVQPAMTARLRSLLNQADRRKLRVIVTLFDHAQIYAPARYPEAEAHLKALSAAIARHPALLAWDLKNESDLDYAANGAETVKAWLVRMSGVLRGLDPRHPITAGYADGSHMGSETESLDYLTFHYYGPETDFGAMVTDLKRRFPNRQLVLGEFGFHTWSDRPGDAHPAAHQFNYLNAMLAACTKQHLQGSLVWNLYDYPELADVPFLSQAPVNRYLGLFDTAGRAKPGVLALQQKVRAIDAETQGAVTPDTRRIELVLSLPKAVRLSLSFIQAGQTLAVQRFQGRAGVNSFSFPVSAADITDLLELRRQARVSAPGLNAELIFRRD